jgi:hypothetical protein
MHREHRGPDAHEQGVGRRAQPFATRKVSLTTTLIIKLPIRSHSLGQRRTRVSNRRLSGGPPHGLTVDGMEEVRGSSPLSSTNLLSRVMRQMSRVIDYALAIGRGVFVGCASSCGRVDGVGAEDFAGE